MTTYTLTTFSDGDTLLASEMNDNFQYCLADTTSKVDALATSLESSTASLTGNNTFTGQNTFTGTTWLSASTVIAKENSDKEGGQLLFQKADNDPLSSHPYIDLYDGTLRFVAQYGGDTRVWEIPFATMVGGTITPLYSKGGSSGSYYRVYADGFRLQWGASFMSGKSKSITFPQSFSNTNYSVFAVGSATGGDEEFNVNANIVSASSANFYGNYNGMGFRWFAIGY